MLSSTARSLQNGGDVELCGETGVLGVAHVDAVEPDVEARVDALEEKEVPVRGAAPGGGQCERASVQPSGVLPRLSVAPQARAASGAAQSPVAVGDLDLSRAPRKGRVELKGIGRVGVDGHVVALHLPMGGESNLVAAAPYLAWLKEVRWAVVWRANELELPGMRTLRLARRTREVHHIGQGFVTERSSALDPILQSLFFLP